MEDNHERKLINEALSNFTDVIEKSILDFSV